MYQLPPFKQNGDLNNNQFQVVEQAIGITKDGVLNIDPSGHILKTEQSPVRNFAFQDAHFIPGMKQVKNYKKDEASTANVVAKSVILEQLKPKMLRFTNQIERTSPRASKEYKTYIEDQIDAPSARQPTIDGTNKCDTESNTPTRVTAKSQMDLGSYKDAPSNINLHF